MRLDHWLMYGGLALIPVAIVIGNWPLAGLALAYALAKWRYIDLCSQLGKESAHGK